MPTPRWPSAIPTWAAARSSTTTAWRSPRCRHPGSGTGASATIWWARRGSAHSEGAVFLSTLCGALCSVLYRPYLRKYPTLPVSAVAMLAAVGFLAVLAVGEGFFVAPPRFTPGGWLAVGFIGVGSGVGYWLWLWALRHAAPTRVTVCLALSPITAAVLGRVFLGEPFGFGAWLGLAVVVIGLWVALSPTEPSEE